jgi:3-oxocholest-4-en-26-oate---CoA ligase
MAWNYGDMLDALGGVVPADRPALVHGERVITWSEYTRRTNNLAQRFLNRGLQAGDKVAFYMRNHPAYLETLGACFKARLVHANVNYRYVDDELHYIIDNSDSRIVVFESVFADHVRKLRARLPNVVTWVEVCDGEPTVEFAVSYEQMADSGDGASLGIERSEDDLLFLYTGGTTGMPKGVMWGHIDLWQAGGAGRSPLGGEPPADVAAHVANVAAAPAAPCTLPCCPLMHGTGLFTAIGGMMRGGTIVTLDGGGFEPAQAWSEVERNKVMTMAIVGDAFAKPLLRTLDENPGRWNLESLAVIISSGVMWSPEVKKGLLKHHSRMVLMDSFGSSEAVGFGSSSTTADGGTAVAKFTIGENCKVFTEDFREVQPGSGEIGIIARTGAIPRGYYKDPDKSAKTFPVIGGVRWSMPGDYCTVEADGTLTLLGRGSVCINTAGEKVFPEEVEEVLKQHPAVHDALVVGLPDEKWGQMVTAVVQPEPGAAFDEAALREHVRGKLAGYKTPKRIVMIENLGRASNGKANYKGVTAYVKTQLGAA